MNNLLYAITPSFKGSASRAEWWAVTIAYSAMIALLWLAFYGLILLPIKISQIAAITIIIVLITLNLIIGIPVSVRRFHDLGMSGLWVVGLFVPILGIVLLLMLMIKSSATIK